MSAQKILDKLSKVATRTRKQRNESFFKTGPGDYAEHDVFIGVSVPQQRVIAKQHKNFPLSEITKLLKHEVHEVRLTALIILVEQYRKTRDKTLVKYYLDNLSHINNWDLVDLSAPHILGHYLLSNDRKILYELADSDDLWRRRVAIVATLTLIKNQEYKEILAIANKVLSDQRDLTHKAVGWMLREVGKQDEAILRNFLEKHGKQMPRTMLRYAIERLDDRKTILEQTR